MIPGVRCESCVYWQAPELGKYGTCFRYPGRPHVTTTAEGETAVHLDARPTPTAEEWCGEWKSHPDNAVAKVARAKH